MDRQERCDKSLTHNGDIRRYAISIAMVPAFLRVSDAVDCGTIPATRPLGMRSQRRSVFRRGTNRQIFQCSIGLMSPWYLDIAVPDNTIAI